MSGLDIPRTSSDDATPATDSSASVAADKYDQMLALADLFDSSGNEMRTRARLGTEVLADDEVVDSGELSKATWGQVEEDIRAAMTGKHGLLTRSVELDADALVVRATVLTYRWIDELQQAAYKTLGSIAGRAIGYLAPEVALGGAIVSAGLIETDAMDRDGVAAYLSELADNNPELMEHLSGGGGLLDGLHMRSLLTAGVLASDQGAHAARGGLRAIGVEPFPTDAVSAFRDSAGSFVEAEEPEAEAEAGTGQPPRSLEELIATLLAEDSKISVQRVGTGRYIAYLPGSLGAEAGRLRLVGADPTTSVGQVIRAIERVVTEDDARVMLVGSAAGGTVAAEIAAAAGSPRFVVDQVVTAGAPSSQVPRIPEATRVLSLEDRSDPVALLGSLINASTPNRLTVVFDAGTSAGSELYVAGAKAADSAEHPELRAEIARMQDLGYLAG
ncbi:hypothetical protein [Nocardioides baculatus]|uniref:Alpha/beta hydrolase n=1 Tax=Nocardioides baculatus TaxID=2801337 RepID=A0ABS1L460_9ACTN|nr:hypothetical protein [Nocardioides baculatus]MBL0746375.1 hypothetical protein [Nocardioides baculatus]